MNCSNNRTVTRQRSFAGQKMIPGDCLRRSNIPLPNRTRSILNLSAGRIINNYLGKGVTPCSFFADYMNDVAHVAIHFRGVTAEGGVEQWISADAPPGH